MQTTVVVLLVAVATLFLVRRFYSSVKKGGQSTCGCGCDGCSPNQKNNCTDIENQPQ